VRAISNTTREIFFGVQSLARKIPLCLLLLSCAGCSSIIEGTSQEIMVNTFPAGASCTLLRNGQAIATVSPTPGSALVRKTKYGINVVCNKAGYAQASAIDHSGSAAAAVAGDLLLPGIGWAIDSASGADNKYDSPMSLTLAQEAALPANATATAQPMTPASIPAGYYVMEMPPGMVPPVPLSNGVALGAGAVAMAAPMQSGAAALQAAPMLYYAVSAAPPAQAVSPLANGDAVATSFTQAAPGEMRLIREYPPGFPASAIATQPASALQAVPPAPVTVANIPAGTPQPR